MIGALVALWAYSTIAGTHVGWNGQTVLVALLGCAASRTSFGA